MCRWWIITVPWDFVRFYRKNFYSKFSLVLNFFMRITKRITSNCFGAQKTKIQFVLFQLSFRIKQLKNTSTSRRRFTRLSHNLWMKILSLTLWEDISQCCESTASQIVSNNVFSLNVSMLENNEFAFLSAITTWFLLIVYMRKMQASDQVFNAEDIDNRFGKQWFCWLLKSFEYITLDWVQINIFFIRSTLSSWFRDQKPLRSFSNSNSTNHHQNLA